MRWLLFVGSLACFIGLYDAEIMQGERTMMFFCESTLGESEAVSAPSSVCRLTRNDHLPRQARDKHSNITKPPASNRFVSFRTDAKPLLDRWGGLLKIPQPAVLSWLFEGGDREEGDGIQRKKISINNTIILVVLPRQAKDGTAVDDAIIIVVCFCWYDA